MVSGHKYASGEYERGGHAKMDLTYIGNIIAIVIIIKNWGLLPDMFVRIFEEAFGIRQVAAGGFGAALMNGVKRGLFSNEAG